VGYGLGAGLQQDKNGMESEQPFTNADIRGASHAFHFAKKCMTAIDEIVSKVEPEFEELFHANFSRSYFSTRYESAFAPATVSRRRPGQCWIYIFIEAYDRELAFGVAVEITRDNMKKLNRFLYWEEDNSLLYTWHPISAQVDSRKMAPKVWADLKKLHGALNRAF
jgi:hypothetical protein